MELQCKMHHGPIKVFDKDKVLIKIYPFISFPLMKRNEPKKNLAKTKLPPARPSPPRSFGPATAPLVQRLR